jgi:hypothetical protein
MLENSCKKWRRKQKHCRQRRGRCSCSSRGSERRRRMRQGACSSRRRQGKRSCSNRGSERRRRR